MKSKAHISRATASPARTAAFDILLRVERESSYAPELLHSKTYNQLNAADRSLATELVMGVLRWRSWLDSRIAESSAQPLFKLDLEILTALRLAVYQLGWLSRIPARAAIYESVELVKRARKRSAAPFVNAVLRKLAAAWTTGQEGSSHSFRGELPETLAADSAHPGWLVERWTQAYGIESARRICEYNQSIPVPAIRIRRPQAERQLEAAGFELGPGSLLSSARRILHGNIAEAAGVRGSWIVQDEASQLVAALVGSAATVLDCCAAPGGKTAAIADRNSNAAIYAVDIHPHRTRLLRRLLPADPRDSEAQSATIRVVAADARKLPFAAQFDRVLADVPCSGTGTLARNPEIKWRLTPEDLTDLQSRQVAILRSAMAQVAPGGRLIYSTCSLEKEENEDVVQLAVAGQSSFRLLDCRTELERLRQAGELIWPDISSLTRAGYLRTLPGVQPCDGFFAAILEKI